MNVDGTRFTSPLRFRSYNAERVFLYEWTTMEKMINNKTHTTH